MSYGHKKWCCPSHWSPARLSACCPGVTTGQPIAPPSPQLQRWSYVWAITGHHCASPCRDFSFPLPRRWCLRSSAFSLPPWRGRNRPGSGGRLHVSAVKWISRIWQGHAILKRSLNILLKDLIKRSDEYLKIFKVYLKCIWKYSRNMPHSAVQHTTTGQPMSMWANFLGAQFQSCSNFPKMQPEWKLFALCNMYLLDCFGMSWVLTRHHFIHVHRFSYHVLICCSSIVPPEAFQPFAAVRSDSSFAPCVAWPRAVARWQSTLHVRSSDREKRLTTADHYYKSMFCVYTLQFRI